VKKNDKKEKTKKSILIGKKTKTNPKEEDKDDDRPHKIVGSFSIREKKFLQINTKSRLISFRHWLELEFPLGN